MSELGIAIRLIRHYEPSSEVSEHDRALALVMRDARELPFMEKLADALEFLRQRKAEQP